MKKLCLFPDCGRPQESFGYCSGHRQQHRRGAELTPLVVQRKRGTAPAVVCDECACPFPELGTPCHIVRGEPLDTGYFQVSFLSRTMPLHRYIWEREFGPIPKGMVVDHVCRERTCCNVDHLRVVTQKQNVHENCVGNCFQLELAKTHCPQNHPYDDTNTSYRKDGSRICRQCHRERSARRYHQRMEALRANRQ